MRKLLYGPIIIVALWIVALTMIIGFESCEKKGRWVPSVQEEEAETVDAGFGAKPWGHE